MAPIPPSEPSGSARGQQIAARLASAMWTALLMGSLLGFFIGVLLRSGPHPVPGVEHFTVLEKTANDIFWALMGGASGIVLMTFAASILIHAPATERD